MFKRINFWYSSVMKILWIDESGDHNLDPKKVQSTYPVFVLAGCIFEEAYYKKIFTPKFNEFKKEFFGSDELILHTLELTRPHRSKDKRYLKVREHEFRVKFYTELNKLIAETEFALIACGIKKVEHVTKYGLEGLDPYLLSFDDLLNHFVPQLDNNEKGKIVAEKRNDNLDNQLELAWLNTKISGTAKIKQADVKEKIENLYMIPKSANEPGIQLADLVASSIGRHILNISRKPGHEVDFEVLKTKLSKSLTIFPIPK